MDQGIEKIDVDVCDLVRSSSRGIVHVRAPVPGALFYFYPLTYVAKHVRGNFGVGKVGSRLDFP